MRTRVIITLLSGRRLLLFVAPPSPPDTPRRIPSICSTLACSCCYVSVCGVRVYVCTCIIRRMYTRAPLVCVYCPDGIERGGGVCVFVRPYRV